MICCCFYMLFVFLYVCSLCCPILNNADDGSVIVEKGFFYGWDRYTILSPLNNAFGGIITGQLVKYAGAVKKGFSVVGALIFTAIAQRLVYGSPLKVL